MPTCKFFLLGQCAKSDCQYLHKKVNDKTAICHEFLRGYCPKAEKCNLRHEFLCPNFESKDGCTVVRCPYVHKSKSVKPVVQQRPTPTIIATEPSSSSTSSAESNKRYFINSNRKPNDHPTSSHASKEKSILGSFSSETDTAGGNSQPMDSVDLCETTNNDPKPFSQRKKLGKLPSFIPID